MCYVLCLVAQSCPTLCSPWTVAHQAPLSMEILQARILEWAAKLSSGYLPNPGIKSRSPTLQASSLPSESPGKPMWHSEVWAVCLKWWHILSAYGVFEPVFLFLFYNTHIHTQGFRGVLVVKNLPTNAGDERDAGLIPRLGRSPGGGHGNPL